MDRPSGLAVEMRNITKRFGSVIANDGVDLSVAKGTIHGIVGENGAGKSTLMRILYGMYRADVGEVIVDGVHRVFRTPQEAISAGVGMVSQHYSIIPELSCIDNLILGFEGGPILDRTTAIERATKLASSLGFAFDWFAEARSLSPAAAQKLEITKLLWRSASILILDEPTAMLSPDDGDRLFRNLLQLADSGRTVLLVTHRLAEVMEYCTRVTVLRNGKLVAETEVTSISSHELASLMVGDEQVDEYTSPARVGRICLSLSDFSADGDRSNLAVNQASLDLREGEVVGFAGVDGNGQKELVEALLGIRSFRGAANLLGRPLGQLSTAERLAGGTAVVPEDRHAQGVIDDWPIADNAILGLHRLKPVSTGWVIDQSAKSAAISEIVTRFNTKISTLNAPISSLSGGNQQRFVVARSLQSEPKLLIAFQPTRGLDIRGSIDVYREIRRRCQLGMCAIVVSFDLDELIEHCDRILVMFDGRISEPPPGATTDRHAIGRMMVGLSP